MTINWNLSQPVVGDPAKVTRGMDEPTLAEMPDGRILMVCRGSNDTKPSLPGYKWYSVSSDDGSTWTTPSPWTYSDGSSFYSPSSCSQLVETSQGKYFWIGNIVPNNPSGNLPRYPLVIGEVDPATMLLEKDTVTTIDDLGAGDSSSLELSNFRGIPGPRDGRDRGDDDAILVVVVVRGRCLHLPHRRPGSRAFQSRAVVFGAGRLAGLRVAEMPMIILKPEIRNQRSPRGFYFGGAFGRDHDHRHFDRAVVAGGAGGARGGAASCNAATTSNRWAWRCTPTMRPAAAFRRAPSRPTP